MKKYLLILLLTINTLVAESVVNSPNIPYVEYKNISPQTRTLSWERKSKSCTESYTFSAFSNLFSFSAHTGKNMLGVYTMESIETSNRTKITLYPIADNGLNDCFNLSKYNSSGKVIIFYARSDLKNNTLNLSDSINGGFFGFYSSNPYISSDRKMDLNGFNNVYRNIKNDYRKAKLKAYRKQQQRKESEDAKDYTGALITDMQKRSEERTKEYKAEQYQEQDDRDFYEQRQRDEDYYNN
jgi:hypothetical protein